MKRIVGFLPVLLLAVSLWLTLGSAQARTDSSVTLGKGQKVRVLANGCNLVVPMHTADLVKVKCVNGTSTVPTSRQTARPDATVTLNLGGRLKILSDQCDLGITKQTNAKVVVVCNPPTVKVGDGGTNYSPQQITIKVGETVHWVWVGNDHTVTGGTAPNADNTFCSPDDTNCGTANPSNAAATYDHQFNTTGTFQYFCKIHGAAMTGTVVVNP